MYEETNPDWAPSQNLGYVAALPNESRFVRLQERNSRKRPNEGFSDELNDHEGNGIVCQPDITTATVETTEAACQTDKDLSELTVLQRKEFNELKTENSKLAKELGDLKSRNENNFTEEFLKKEENRSILKFYTGRYTGNNIQCVIDMHACML